MVGILTYRPSVCKCRVGYDGPVATQTERRERTRSAIVEAATDLFVERGFAETTIADILAAAGVSRGALYHHFTAKEDVFAAVYAKVSAQAITRAGRSGRAARSKGSRLDALIVSCLSWIDIAVDDAVATILFVEGPKALGWDRCRDIEEAASLGRVRAGLAAAAGGDEITGTDLDLTARIVNAALAEAALAIHTGRPGATRAGAKRTITALLTGLATPTGDAEADDAPG